MLSELKQKRGQLSAHNIELLALGQQVSNKYDAQQMAMSACVRAFETMSATAESYKRECDRAQTLLGNLQPRFDSLTAERSALQ